LRNISAWLAKTAGVVIRADTRSILALAAMVSDA
jgi:hypothetical protein